MELIAVHPPNRDPPLTHHHTLVISGFMKDGECRGDIPRGLHRVLRLFLLRPFSERLQDDVHVPLSLWHLETCRTGVCRSLCRVGRGALPASHRIHGVGDSGLLVLDYGRYSGCYAGEKSHVWVFLVEYPVIASGIQV